MLNAMHYLLVDIFKSLWDKGVELYNRSPSYFLSTQRIGRQGTHRKTEAELELLTDVVQWTHLRFTIVSTSKFHIEKSPIFHPLWKSNPRFDKDSSTSIQISKLIKYWQIIHVIFQYCFGVEMMKHLVLLLGVRLAFACFCFVL